MAWYYDMVFPLSYFFIFIIVSLCICVQAKMGTRLGKAHIALMKFPEENVSDTDGK